ncbi:hypothetical protein [Megasphaera sp.]|uniref:hypothetical protein n=1 Tax=Megasphaera sp. TaxID=2023260 RepID=UPI0027BAE672|nr:hypothetical protein [Megasphaera sp.]
MKMWKIFGLTLALTTVAAASFASVPQSALRIGGIPFDTESSVIRSIYGMPTKVDVHMEKERATEDTEYEYGNSVSIDLKYDRVHQIEVSANNGWETADGVHVGMTSDQVKMIYGEPDAVRDDHYIYYVTGRSDLGIDIEIENDRVEEITVGKLDK